MPFLILATFAAPATRTLLQIYDADESDLDVMITGYQWKWKYEYLDKGVSFFSALSTSPNEYKSNDRRRRASTTCSKSTSRW